MDLERAIDEVSACVQESLADTAASPFEVKARAALPHYLKVCQRVLDTAASEARSTAEPLLIALAMAAVAAGRHEPSRYAHLGETARASSAKMGPDIASEVDRSVTLVRESDSPVAAVAGAFEEFLWRSGYGFDALKQLQYELLRSIKSSRFGLLHEAADLREYRQRLDDLGLALSQSLFGPVSVALCRFESLSSNHQRALRTRYSDEDIFSLRTLLIEADELRANLEASRLLEPAFPDAFASRLSWTYRSRGALAARRLLRESRNVRFHPAEFEIRSLDGLIASGSVASERILEVVGNRSGTYKYIVTATPRDDAPPLADGMPFSDWNIYAMNFATIHELTHLAWSAWMGLPRIANPTYELTFSIPKGSEGPKITIVIDGSGILQIATADHSPDVKDVANRVDTAMQNSYALRRRGDSRAAIRAIEEVQHDLAHEQKTLDSDQRIGLHNAIAGALVDDGRAEAAIGLYAEILAVASATHGPASCISA
jgi:hypothetical protein